MVPQPKSFFKMQFTGRIHSTWMQIYAQGPDGKFYTTLPNGRTGFGIHTGLGTNGCITVPSDVLENSYNYLHSASFDSFVNFVKGYSVTYNNDSFSGYLTVK
jgi:hypothetical protein